MIDQDFAEAIRRTLDADRAWGVYGLADLQDALAPDCSWQLRQGADGRAGLALLYAGLQPPVLLTAGTPALLAECLTEWDVQEALPQRVYLSIREEHEPVIRRWYDNSRDRRSMLRMALIGPSSEVVAPLAVGLMPIRLQPADVPRIAALYAHGGPFTPDAFGPHQLDDGIFFGLEETNGDRSRQRQLIAVGGTHVVDWQAGIAAIGNMYTHPAQRGRGYAGVILAAIVAVLRANAPYVRSILNVDQRNTGARRLYEKHGFSVHCPYLEGIAHRCR